MKDPALSVRSRFPFGPQVSFVQRVLDMLDLRAHFAASDGEVEVFEKRASDVREDSWYCSVPIGPGLGSVADHLEAILTLIVPCDGDAQPIPTLRCGGRTFQPTPALSDPFSFVFPVPPASPTRETFQQAALAVLSEYFWLCRSEGSIPSRRTRPDDAVRLPPDLGSRVSLRVKGREIHPLHGVAQSEPAIVAVARYLSVFLAHHEVADENGHPISAPYFQLRSARDWIVQSQVRPNANEIFAYLSRVCNIACEFCYLFGNPATISIARGSKMISKAEMDLRLALFEPKNGQQLFKATWEINEVLVDPKFEMVARNLRAQSDERFFFITNGNPLTPRKVAFLEELKPVELIISTNTIDSRARSELMHEKEMLTKVALGCFDDLDSRQVCYGVSMVALPDQSFDELETTIRQLDARLPAFIRLNLVGYTKDHPSKLDFDVSDFWGRTVRWVQSLRHDVKTPIIIIPSAYEENFFYDRPNAARIVGTVRGSPASRSGLRPHDEIIAVGELETNNRAQVRGLLSMLDRPTPLRIVRDGRELELIIDPTVQATFPFVGDLIAKYFVPKGVVLAPALSPSDFRDISASIQHKEVRSAAILTSALMRPAVEDLMDKIDLHGADVRLVTVRNDFLGGNICVLDMATVADMVGSVRREVADIKLDRIFVPASSFTELGRDLAGQHWHDIEVSLGVPVTLLSRTTRFAF
jgi:hypothetical protein